MSRPGLEARASDNQVKFIQQRISKTEDHFGKLCTDVGSYSRKLSKIRDRGDDIAKELMIFSEEEKHNKTTKSALFEFAGNFSALQDYREAEIRRIENQVIAPLGKYGDICKTAKARIKQASSARDRELKKQRNLDKIRTQNASNVHQVTLARQELSHASADASRSVHDLEHEMDTFERRKLTDLKRVLIDFVSIEMNYHAKAVELLTFCYQNAQAIDEEEDLEELRNFLRPAHLQSRMASAASSSRLNVNGGGMARDIRSSPQRTPKGRHNVETSDEDDESEEEGEESEEEERVGGRRAAGQFAAASAASEASAAGNMFITSNTRTHRNT